MYILLELLKIENVPILVSSKVLRVFLDGYVRQMHKSIIGIVRIELKFV